MRYLLSLLAAALLAVPASAAADSVNIVNVYTVKNSSASLGVLRLMDNNSYEYCYYTKKKITRDIGEYTLSKHRLQLKSQLKKHGYNPLLNRTLYVSSEGLHRTRMQAVLKQKSMMTVNDEVALRNDWNYNPLTKTRQEDPATKTASVPAAPVAVNNAESNASSKASGEFAKNYYIGIADKYAGPYGNMLRKAYCGPDCYSTLINGVPVAWNSDTTSGTLFGEYETVIHESTHHYNNSTYMIVPGTDISVPTTTTYTSSEFAAMVPADASKNIFRYDTYVGKDSYVSANVSGIYGLLDEYSAYCNGVRACLVSANTAMAKKDTAMARSFISQATGTYYAHYEFRLFIAWYLHYASEKHKDVYDGLMGNNNLRVAFTLLDDEFRRTIFSLNKAATLSGYGSSSFTTAYYQNDYSSYCGKQLAKEESWLTQFKVKGVTMENYKTFVK